MQCDAHHLLLWFAAASSCVARYIGVVVPVVASDVVGIVVGAVGVVDSVVAGVRGGDVV